MFTGIETLEKYVLVPQKPGDFTIFRKANNWREEKVSVETGELRLESLQLSVPRSAIYEGFDLLAGSRPRLPDLTSNVNFRP